MDNKIIIKGARENNLKNINIELPKNKLIVMTGLSGSGKSSLAFDTIYAEGQRRYVESLSSYARQFLGGSEKPDVDSIEGLSPAISIDQKTTSKNPRSTVGTVTEIYDYLRLLFSRAGTAYCPNHHIPITSQSVEEITNKILEYDIGTRLIIYSPVVHHEKGTHKDLFEKLRKEGYVRVRVNGENHDLDEDIVLEKNKQDDIDVIIDRIVLKEDSRSRISEAVETATKLSEGKVVVEILGENKKEIVFSENFACPYCEFSLPEIEPRLFSFNAPFGACPDCKGLGIKLSIDENLVIPDKDLSINEGCIKTLSDDQEGIYYKKLECVCKHYKIDMDKPFKKLTKKERDIVLYGSPDIIHFNYKTKGGNIMNNRDFYEGIINNLERRYMETSSSWIREWLEHYMIEHTCETCHGARLQDSVLAVKINKKNIYEVTQMSIKDLVEFFKDLKLSEEKAKIEGPISLAWDYYSEYVSAPTRTGKITGVNVVSPSFFYMTKYSTTNIYENVGNEGIAYVNWAHGNGYQVWPMFTNSNMSETSKMLSDYKSRENVINQIIKHIKQYNLDGINIDFEGMYETDKDNFSRFLIEIRPRLNEIGAVLSVDVTAPDGAPEWSLCYDRYTIGKVADYVMFMAYDQYGVSATKAGTTAGYNWVEANVKKFLGQEEVKAEKIILGIPFYTRVWKEINGNVISSVVNIGNVNNLIPSNATKTWDEDLQQYYVEYKKGGATYKIWVEDEKSIEAKLDLVSKYNLGGAAYWEYDRATNSIWNLIESKIK